MKLFKFPNDIQLIEILKRPQPDAIAIADKVQAIINAVAEQGDAALIDFAAKYDKAIITDLKVSTIEISNAASLLTDALKQAIRQAKKNIEVFHDAQLSATAKIETMPGVFCWRKSVGIDKVGLYIPGGTAPLFSTVLMLAVPATIAGCKEIILCTPPKQDGSIANEILFTASLCGITKIFKCGGAQAIAAMAYGTATIPAVYKIFGPGNRYVTSAKQLLQSKVAIDMPAGPSEVMVLADETAVPEFVAADLLAQAEHGPDSQVMLVTTSATLAAKVETAIQEQLNDLSRKEIAATALSNSKTILVNNMEEAISISNAYAPEHLIICTVDGENVAEKISNAGSVFIGNYSPESVGDYASGTNHTLPTNGYAAMYSGVSVDSFVKKITFQQLTKQGLSNIAGTVTVMAAAEGLEAHSNAVKIRINK